jgi:hypothetical protein
VTGITSFTDPENTTIEISPGDGWVKVTNLTGGYGSIGSYGIGVSDGINPEMSIQSDKIVFPNGSEQSTAGLPLTGGTVLGNVNFGDVDHTVSVGFQTLTVTNATTTYIGDGIQVFQQDLPSPQAQSTEIYPTGLHINSVNEYDEGETFNVTLQGIQKTGNGSFSLLQESGLELDYGVKLNYTTGLTLAPGSASKITFQDLTEQTTAALPLTGGTLSAGLLVNAGDYNYDFGDIGLILGNSINNYSLNFNNSFGLVLEGTGNGITFPDSSVQETAFPGYSGTISQYIRGDGSLETYGPLGDRYLTSSTSTLTCDSGNGKTMTVETGLSYSRQQDITVSYNNANHMHGTVLTYDSATGVMTFDSNTHSGSGTYSSWEVNVGGVAGAILPVGGTAGQVLAKINSTNFNTEWISLGSMAEATTTDYLAKADNLSGLASTSTARTNLGLGAVSTDGYATTAQAEAMISTATVLSPARFRDAYFTANVTKPNTSTWITGTTGTGGLNDGGNGDFRRLQGPTSAANTIVRASHLNNFRRGGDYNSNINWTKYNALYFRLRQSGADTNSTFIITLGEDSTGAGNADPAVRCVGIKFNYGGVVKILAHNGTTLVQPTTSYTPATSSGIDFLIVSDGSGTVEVFADGVSIGTTTGGPTTLLAGTSGQQCINARVFNNSTPSGGQLLIYIGGVTAYTS